MTVSAGGALGAFFPGVCLRPICSDAGEIGFSLFWLAGPENPALKHFIDAARSVAGVSEGEPDAIERR